MDNYKKSLGIGSITGSIILLIILGVQLMGCSPAPTFIKPDFEKRTIKVIAIMPIIDKRITAGDTLTSKEILTNIEELVSEKIVEKNYDVISAGTVKKLLKGKEIQDMTPAELSSFFKADGILYSELYDYADAFFVNHSLKMHFNLYDASGDSLWINDVDDNDKPFLSALGASAGWAIGVAVDNKVSSKNKLPIILAGVAAAELIYAAADGIRDETSESIERVFKSLPEVRGTIK